MKYWNGAVSPYSSPMKSSGTNGDSSTTADASLTASSDTRLAQPFAHHPIADLVVVLREDDKLDRKARHETNFRAGGRG